MAGPSTLSVVVPHYFVPREPNLQILVDALRKGTQPPNEIVVWNNDQPLAKPLVGARLIQSAWNLGCKARFLGALAAVGDWILFQDNDVSVRPGTVANLLRYAVKCRDAVVSLDGRVTRPGESHRAYRGTTRVRGRLVPVVTPVEITLGRMELMSRATLMRVLARFPFREDVIMDDLVFSQAASEAGVSCYVVPCAPNEDVSDLPDYDVGLSVTHRDAYYAERNRLTEALRTRGTAGAVTSMLDVNGHPPGWNCPDNGV